MKINGRVVSCHSLTDEEIGAMYRLLEASFVNVRREVFERDLREKDEVVLLYGGEEGGKRRYAGPAAVCSSPSGFSSPGAALPITRTSGPVLCGFSTIQFLHYRYAGQTIRIVFSGDTIIDPKFWGSLQLPVIWGRRMMELLEERPHEPLWWLLISKGIRTFKFLPVFFRSYFPNPAADLPPETARLMNSLGKLRFPSQFDHCEGVVRPVPESYFLRPALLFTRGSKKSYADFFYSRNPAFSAGAELFCLAEFSRENLHPFILRRIDERREKPLAMRKYG